MNRRHVLLKCTALVASACVSTRALAVPGGVSDREIVLGSSGAISGPIGAPLRGILAGAGLAFASVNAAGGINGRKIRLVSLDDELKPERAVANYKALASDHQVLAFFGCGGSATTAAGAPIVKDCGAPMFGGFGVADSSRRKVAGSAFFVRASSSREAQVLTQHIATLGITRVAMATFDNPGGKEALGLVEAAFAEQKLKLNYTGAVKGDASNAAEVGQAIAKAAPQAVIMYLVASQAAAIISATRDAGGLPSFYGMSLVPGEAVAKALGEKMLGLSISQVVPYPWAASEVEARNFRKLADAAKVDVGYPSYEGYVNGLVMLEALRRSGRDVSRAQLHSTLRSLKIRTASMDVDFTTDANIAGSRYVDMVHVSREGRFTR